MLKPLCRFLASVCSLCGLERLSTRLLVSSIEVTDVKIPIIHLKNSQHETIVRKEIPDRGVVFEDKLAIAELGDRYSLDVKLPESILDVN